MKNKFRILLALTLALVMVFGNVLTVAADGEGEVLDEPIVVYQDEVYVCDSYPSPDSELSETGVLDGSIIVDGDDAYHEDCFGPPAALTVATGPSPTVEPFAPQDDAAFEVTQNVEVTNVEGEPMSGVLVVARGDIESEGSGEPEGPPTYSETTATATVGGKVVVTSEEGPAEAAHVQAQDNGTATLNIGKGAEGQITLSAENDGTANLNITEGGIEADSLFYDRYVPGSMGYPYAPDAALNADNRNGEINAVIEDGGITTNGSAVYSSTVAIDYGRFGFGEGEPGEGEDAPPAPTAVTTIKLAGDISIDSKSEDHEESRTYKYKGLNGVDLHNQGENSTTNFSLEGNITVNDDGKKATGLNIENGRYVPCNDTGGYYTAGTMNVTVEGNIAVTGAEESTAINVQVEPGIVQEYKKSDLGEQVKDYSLDELRKYYDDNGGNPHLVKYVRIDGVSADVLIIKDGDKTRYIAGYYTSGTGEGDWYYTDAYEMDPEKLYQANDTKVLVEGDVTADTNGIRVDAEEEGGNANIIVNGTVKGDTASAVLVGDTEIGKGVTLTVWKLEGDVVRESVDDDFLGDDGEEDAVKTEKISDEEYKEIQYIIRIKQDDDTKKAFKDLTGATGNIGRSDLGDEYKYIAREDDVVTAIIEAPEGYEIVQAVANAEGVELTKVSEGKYQLTVKRGGGYEIAVTLKKLPDPEPDPEPEPEPDEPDEPDTVAITYILGNDAQYDHIRTNAAVGEGVALQPAPEREGYTFLYWQCTDVDPNSPYYKQPDPDNDFQFRPGAIYTAKKDINFVAVWQKN